MIIVELKKDFQRFFMIFNQDDGGYMTKGKELSGNVKFVIRGRKGKLEQANFSQILKVKSKERYSKVNYLSLQYPSLIDPSPKMLYLSLKISLLKLNNLEVQQIKNTL